MKYFYYMSIIFMLIAGFHSSSALEQKKVPKKKMPEREKPKKKAPKKHMPKLPGGQKAN